MIVDSMTRGDIHTFVRPIVMWHVPDDKHSRTYSYVAVHWTWKCGLPHWSPWLASNGWQCWLYTLPQKKRNFNFQIVHGDPGPGSVTPGHAHQGNLAQRSLTCTPPQNKGNFRKVAFVLGKSVFHGPLVTGLKFIRIRMEEITQILVRGHENWQERPSMPSFLLLRPWTVFEHFNFQLGIRDPFTSNLCLVPSSQSFKLDWGRLWPESTRSGSCMWC